MSLPNLSAPLPDRTPRLRLKCALPAFLVLAAALRISVAQPAPCAPTFRAIHDFQVGDVFQYREWQHDNNWSNRKVVETFRKVRITSRHDSAGTLTYGIHSISRTNETLGNQPATSSSSFSDDILRHVDSASHRLNACHWSIVPFPEMRDPMHTRVEILQANINLFPLARPGQILKVLGRYIGSRTGDTTMAYLADAGYTLVYAEGLGLVAVRIGGGPGGISHTEDLIGHVRGTDTIGVVWKDVDLVSVSIRRSPAQGLASRSAPGRPWTFGNATFDLLGRRLSVPVRPKGIPLR